MSAYTAYFSWQCGGRGSDRWLWFIREQAEGRYRGRGGGRLEDITFQSNEPRCSKAGLVLHRDSKRDY